MHLPISRLPIWLGSSSFFLVVAGARLGEPATGQDTADSNRIGASFGLFNVL